MLKLGANIGDDFAILGSSSLLLHTFIVDWCTFYPPNLLLGLVAFTLHWLLTMAIGFTPLPTVQLDLQAMFVFQA